MKNFRRLVLLLSVIMLVTVSNQTLSAQKLKPADVPSDVTQTLEFQYPYVKVTGWQKDGNQYVATIKDEGSVGKVYISSAGTWIRTTFNVPQGELPTAITEYVKINYPEFIISQSCLEEKENEKTHYYLEVKMDGVGNQPSKLVFSTSGKNELISRKDPENFKDPLAPAVKPEPKPVVAKEPKPAPQTKPTTPTKTTTPTQTTTPAKPQSQAKPTASKPVAQTKSETTKPASQAKSATTKSEPKPVAAKTESKSTPAKPEPKPVAKTEPQKPAKEEKPKKEKPEPVIKDEQGNIAIKENTVPELVKKALAKKIMHPEELNWFHIDTMYVAKCMNTGKKTACYITPSGIWEKTLTVMPEESVTGPMLKHLNDYYKGWKFKDAVKEQRADKDDKTMIEFYEKANLKQKLVTTVIFDKTGKLIRSIDPDYELGGTQQASSADEALDKYYEKMNMSLESDDAKNVPDNVQAVFKLKYPKVANVEWKEDDNMNYQAIYFSTRGKEICVINSYGEIVETMVMGKLDNLSTTIQDNIKKDHKGFKVTEYYTVRKIAEKLNLYKVYIQNKKTQEEDILWFNTSGRPVEY